MNKKKAQSLLEQALLHAQRGEWAACADAAKTVATASSLDAPQAHALWGQALAEAGDLPGAAAALEAGLVRYPKEADLHARRGALALGAGDVSTALAHFKAARGALKRDPTFLTHSALALLRAGQVEAAESDLAAALLCGGGPDTRLVLALAKARRGALAEAEGLALQVEAQAATPGLAASASSAVADFRLMQGDSAAALARWRALDAAGTLEPGQLGHMAWAAQLEGDDALANTLVARCEARGPTAEDRLLFSRIATLTGRFDDALSGLLAAEAAPGERYPGFDYEVLVARGKALRLAGRRDEAQAVLSQALALPDALATRLGAQVQVELGHLAAEAGAFDAAHDAFEKALSFDPKDPEAQRARALTENKVAWRKGVQAGADEQVDAARVELETLRRRFMSREGEVEALKRELERMKKQAASAQAQVQQVETEASRQRDEAKAAQQRQLQEELVTREKDIDAKALANVEQALGPGADRCPPTLRQVLLVAERTYQTALYTELPAAAVAVLYSGALERSLYHFFVARFDEWLDRHGHREVFLREATKERRAGRAVYFDHFSEAFDRTLPPRPPGLGEVSRVLERRAESQLALFRRFLTEAYPLPDAFFGAAAVFVQWAKEKLRDPVAHGRGIELGYDELKALREQLLFRFGGGEGFIRTLLGA